MQTKIPTFDLIEGGNGMTSNLSSLSKPFNHDIDNKLADIEVVLSLTQTMTQSNMDDTTVADEEEHVVVKEVKFTKQAMNGKKKVSTLGSKNKKKQAEVLEKSKDDSSKLNIPISKGLKQEIDDSLQKSMDIKKSAVAQELELPAKKNITAFEESKMIEPPQNSDEKVKSNITTPSPNRFFKKKNYDEFKPTFESSNSTTDNRFYEKIKEEPEKKLKCFQVKAIKPFDPYFSSKENMSSNIPRVELKEEEEPKVTGASCYLLVNNLESDDINSQITYNLFRSFGTLHELYFFREESHALLFYNSEQDALKTRAAMNGRVFCGCKLKIKILEAEHFKLLLKCNEYEKYPMHSKTSSKPNERSKKGLNNPTETIHISNLKPEFVTYELLTSLFAKFGAPKAVKISQNGNKPMSYIQFHSIEESILAVAHMNGKDVRGKKLNVAFTRTQIS